MDILLETVSKIQYRSMFAMDIYRFKYVYVMYRSYNGKISEERIEVIPTVIIKYDTIFLFNVYRNHINRPSIIG